MTGHVRQRSPGSFELRYRDHGKTRTATFRGTKREADRELRRLLSLVDNNQHPSDPDRLTVSGWLSRWLGQVKGEAAPRTHLRYSEFVRLHITPQIGDVPLARLSVADVQGLYSGLAEKTKLSAQSRKHAALVLTNALNRAVEQRLIASNPAQPLKRRLPRVERSDMRFLDQGQSQRLLEFARPTSLYPAVLTGLATGARRGEILALKWSRFDLEGRGTVLIAESLEQMGSSIRTKPPKNGKPRTIVLGAAVIEELRRVKIEQAEALLALGIRQDGETLVCCRADGSMLTPSRLSDGFRALISKSGLPRVRFHDLRHSHASQLLAAGINIKVVAERLGHADPAVTLRVYSNLMPEAQAEAAARIDTIFRSIVAAQ
ncbi:MAG TPA: site-specific integrase [Stellaceae bacterium]|nr:site-specific integrase [Stellaceae bacterium]